MRNEKNPDASRMVFPGMLDGVGINPMVAKRFGIQNEFPASGYGKYRTGIAPGVQRCITMCRNRDVSRRDQDEKPD